MCTEVRATPVGWLPGELPFHGTRHCVMVQNDEDPEVGTQSGRFSLHTVVLKNGCTVPYPSNQTEPDCEAHPTWQGEVSGCITPGAPVPHTAPGEASQFVWAPECWRASCLTPLRTLLMTPSSQLQRSLEAGAPPALIGRGAGMCCRWQPWAGQQPP